MCCTRSIYEIETQVWCHVSFVCDVTNRMQATTYDNYLRHVYARDSYKGTRAVGKYS